MTKNPFDQFSKQFFEEFLTPLGVVQINYEIPGEPRFVDIWFTPSNQPAIDSTELGILAKIAATPCLLEPFRNQPTEREIRSCLGKLIRLEADLVRSAKRDEKSISEEELPQLWIIATSVSERLLNKLIASEDETWLPGIYFLSKVFLTGIIAINNLPRIPETLWLRILGKGVIQQQAINELIALPKEYKKRSAVLKLLATWKITMGVSNEVDLEERELIMNLSQAYLEWEQETKQQGIQQGVQQGVQQGIEQERYQLLENLLSERFGEVDSQLSAIAPAILNLPPKEYASLLLQLSSLSREELLMRFR